jgi:hypothetical protein
MSASTRSETQETFTQKLQNTAVLSSAFDRGLAVKIGARIAMRRSLCGLSKLQLAARLGIDSAERGSVRARREAYELYTPA